MEILLKAIAAKRDYHRLQSILIKLHHSLFTGYSVGCYYRCYRRKAHRIVVAKAQSEIIFFSFLNVRSASSDFAFIIPAHVRTFSKKQNDGK